MATAEDKYKMVALPPIYPSGPASAGALAFGPVVRSTDRGAPPTATAQMTVSGGSARGRAVESRGPSGRGPYGQ